MVVIFASTYTYVICLLLLLLTEDTVGLQTQVKNYNIEITSEVS